MKKAVLIIIPVLILSVFLYFFIAGGKPRIENFQELSADYEIVAKFLTDSYSELKPYDAGPESEIIIVDIYGDSLKCNDYYPELTAEQKNAVLTVKEKFYFFAVYEDAVYFSTDEAANYGLVYSSHPLISLYKQEYPQSGRHYNRINGNWYEWGCFDNI